MTDYTSETYEEVRELLQRASWEILDEEQRDDLMKNVVVPRWGKVTADGVELKATAWAKALGTTEETVRGRYRRLTSRSEAADGRSHRSPTPNEESHVRSAKSAIRKHPELAKKLLGDPDVTEAVEKAVAADLAATARVNQAAAQQRPTPVRPAPERSPMSAAASAAALEAAAAQLRRATDEVVADVMDGHLAPELIDEPLRSVEVDAKRLRMVRDTNENLDQALADLLNGEDQ